jgi:ribulose-5-phosphate 4-epimerase/fuculose-1-phosphate aldolase
MSDPSTRTPHAPVETLAVSDPPDVVRLAQALADFRWVQGAGGNVSEKRDGVLFVKASGRRLREVGTPGALSRAPLAVAERAQGGDSEADQALFAVTPRPSMEAYFHALPGRIVAHTHSLGVLLFACSDTPLAALHELVPDVREIAYVEPGPGLAAAVRAARSAAARHGDAAPPYEAVLLRSHGLVVFADTVEGALEATTKIDGACARIVGVEGAPDFQAPEGDALRETAEGVFAIDVPPRTRGAEPGRYLFPDAAVYATEVLLDATAFDGALEAEIAREAKRPIVLTLAKGERRVVATSRDALLAAVEVLAAHDWVESVLVPRGRARYLSPEAAASVVALPAEKYRTSRHS